jgi:predicted HicB family RNase H-like nuclease
VATKMRSLRLGDELWERAAVAAAAAGVSRSEWVVRALESALEVVQGDPSGSLRAALPSAS